MAKFTFDKIAYDNVDDFVYGSAPRKLELPNGMVIGGGTVYPEINFTLPPMQVKDDTIQKAYSEYRTMITDACQRAAELQVPGLVVEIELVPDMTFNPEWGIEVCKIVKGVMKEHEDKYGLKSVLRMTPVDIREGNELKHMWKGEHWEKLIGQFEGLAKSGADLFSIESVGGKNLHDDGIMYFDMAKTVFSLGVVGARDMQKLWGEIVKISDANNVVPAGDTACAFANTSMVLAVRGMIPSVYSAVDRVMCGVRSMIAQEEGALGPDKDCAYEGPYVKMMTGVPISMEGKTAAFAHNSFCGNIAGAVCDVWSNESVENKRLLGGNTAAIATEMLAYDTRLMNTAGKAGHKVLFRDLLVESDSHLDPHAYIMRPDVVFNISKEIVKGKTHFERVKIAGICAAQEIRKGYDAKKLALNEREVKYLDMIDSQFDAITDDEEAFINDQLKNNTTVTFDPAEYDM